MNLSELEDVKLSSITELEDFFRTKNIPEEKIRFFVNENRQEPRCFGIYQDVESGDFIVYKNKDDGSRYIRYQGQDEKEAVSIFFDKLKEEMAKRDTQGLYRSTIDTTKEQLKKKRSIRLVVILIVVSVVIGVAGIFMAFKNRPRTGYYNYGDSYYYYGNDSWWYYDSLYDDWYLYDGYLDNYNDYYYGNNYNDSYGYSDIDDSYNYEQYSDSYNDSYHYSSDDFDSYDFDSWDSGSTDWGSDW